jgi:uncharacterized protein
VSNPYDEPLPRDTFADAAVMPRSSEAFPSAVAAESGPQTLPPNPDDPPWSVPAALLFWFASVMLLAFVPALFLVPYAFSRGVTFQALSRFAQTDVTAILVQVAATVPAHLLTLGLAWLLVTRGGKRPFLRTLGWEWGGRFNLLTSVVSALGLLALGGGIIWLTGSPETPLDKIISSSRATALTTAFVATFTAPLVEEVIYRGVLYSAIQRAIGSAWAVVLVCALFALIHVPQYVTSPGVVAAILILSVFITYVRAHTGNLLPCFVIHLVFNGVQSFFIALAPYLTTPDQGKTETAGALVNVFGLIARAGWAG